MFARTVVTTHQAKHMCNEATSRREKQTVATQQSRKGFQFILFFLNALQSVVGIRSERVDREVEVDEGANHFERNRLALTRRLIARRRT
jgi:hypothetical protein